MNTISKILFSLTLLISLDSHALDIYNPTNNQLTIKKVFAGGIAYNDVVITVGKVVSVAGGSPNGTVDLYNFSNNQLTIPEVDVDGTTYTNVVINVGEILSVGSSTSTDDENTCEQQTQSWATTGKRSLNDKPWGWSQVETPVRLGKVSQRFEVRAGDCAADNRWDDCAQDRERSEWVVNGQITPNSQKAFSWSIYLDPEFKDSPIVKTTLGQLHQEAWFKNGPLLQFELWNGQYQMCIHRLSGDINNATDKCEYWPLAKLSDMKGKWTDIKFYLDSNSRTGSLKVWVNEKVKADIKTPVVTWDPNYFYFKYGIYRTFVSNHGGPMPTQIAYFDEVRIANKISQVNLSCPMIPVD